MDHTPTPWRAYGGGKSIGIAQRFEDTTPIKDIVDIASCRVDEKEIDGYANASFIVRAVNSHDALVEALEEIEDTLGFHEGSEEIMPGLSEGAKPVIWINAQSDSGDFQRMLSKARAALKQAESG